MYGGCSMMEVWRLSFPTWWRCRNRIWKEPNYAFLPSPAKRALSNRSNAAWLPFWTNFVSIIRTCFWSRISRANRNQKRCGNSIIWSNHLERKGTRHQCISPKTSWQLCNKRLTVNSGLASSFCIIPATRIWSCWRSRCPDKVQHRRICTWPGWKCWRKACLPCC